MRPTPAWKSFQDLVARIESRLLPAGATVSSPDRLKDHVTGRIREVDASIRYRIGTVDVLVTIECRHRGRKATVEWIEQLAQKRAAIRATKTVAVTASGASTAATLAAAAHGIDLRTLQEATSRDLESWFLPTHIVHVFRDDLVEECIVYLQCDDGSPMDRGLRAPDVFEPVFHYDGIQSPFPAVVLFKLLEKAEPERFAAVPLDGSVMDMRFKFRLTPGQLLLQGQHGLYKVHHTLIIAKVGYKLVNLDIHSGVHHRYKIGNDAEIYHSLFRSEVFGSQVIFEHLRDDRGEEYASWDFIDSPAGCKPES